MQIVINISEELYGMILNLPNYVSAIATQAVRDGTPLPKGHGELIDAREVYKKFYCRCLGGVANEVLNETPTIIEADKEQEE